MTTMRAVVHDRYGSPEVLRLETIERPVPKEDEVLIRIHVSSVNRTDCGFRQGVPVFVRVFSGVRRPKFRTLGNELAGVVEGVGSAVTRFAVGDRVFGVDQLTFGANAEYTCMRQDGPLATMPAGMSFEEGAAMCDGFILAMTCLRGADLQRGQRILIYGATGSIGTAGVQLAHDMGAHVTAVADTRNLDLARSLGADVVIDRLAEDFASNGETYDVVFDAVGKSNFAHCRGSLTPRGRYVTTDLGRFWHNPPLILLTAITCRFGGRRAQLPLPRYRVREVELLRQMYEAGTYRAVIDRSYPLADVVEATRYVEAGQKVGNVLLTMVRETAD